jgi:hypothetical protein
MSWVYVDEHPDSINDAGFFNPHDSLGGRLRAITMEPAGSRFTTAIRSRKWKTGRPTAGEDYDLQRNDGLEDNVDIR